MQITKENWKEYKKHIEKENQKMFAKHSKLGKKLFEEWVTYCRAIAIKSSYFPSFSPPSLPKAIKPTIEGFDNFKI